MKNQYFGDINDYKKYGLLRAIIEATDFTVLVNWMLTPDDNSMDGNFTAYLQQSEKHSHHDPELFEGLQRLVLQQGYRSVSAIEETDLLPGARYFSLRTPDSSTRRREWFNQSMDCLGGVSLVFLDPDNGLAVPSKPYGRKGSSKYLYWREVKPLWSAGKSLLIYQHFPREERSAFVQRMTEALRQVTPNSFVEAFSTANVVFLMALQPPHQHRHKPIVDLVQDRWGEMTQHWDLSPAGKKAEDMMAADFAAYAEEVETEAKHGLKASNKLIAELGSLKPEEQAWMEWFSGLSGKDQDLVELFSQHGIFVDANNFDQVQTLVRRLTK